MEVRLDDPRVEVDYGGARGSNTGDEFHELWAVREILRMLDSSAILTAITVEGVRAAKHAQVTWDAVDCALLFGAETLGAADYVEIQQLKYSAANSNRAWTVAQVCGGRSPRKSLIRRLATTFKNAIDVRRDKAIDTLKVSLVTNRPISARLIAPLLEARGTKVPNSFNQPWSVGDPDLHRIFRASGLNPDEFKLFADALDFHGKVGSRFAVEDDVLGAITRWSDAEFIETARRLREYVRKRMLPESAGDVITKQNVLIQFGVSDERAMFPCPAAFSFVDMPVERAVSRNVVEQFARGQQMICLHGSSGVGKTTALKEIEQHLPEGSVMILFDCYGAGSYLDASALRHRPRDAFVQLSNELAVRLRLPALLDQNVTRDYARAFRKRLDIAAHGLQLACPNALLVIAVDAADNSITAAINRTPPELSFVTEIMTFKDLPENVCIVVSARTGRLNELKPPTSFRRIEIHGFSVDETASNVARRWNAPRSWIEDFHHLSSGNPRVQGYAFDRVDEEWRMALDALRPAGKDLDGIFDEQFRAAIDKSGDAIAIERICAALTVLPRPIPITELACILGMSRSRVADTCLDLAPGVRNEQGLFSFADEDFESFVRRKGGSAIRDVRRIAAERFMSRAASDVYAARHAVPLLFLAKRGSELLDFVEREPEPPATLMADPMHRREVHDQRVLTAIRVCREAGDPARAVKFVLIGAEALRTRRATRSLLSDFPRLTASYDKDTASRLILSDSRLVERHGSLLACLIGEDGANGDAVAVRDGRRRLHAWFEMGRDDYEARVGGRGRRPHWGISPRNLSAILYGTALLSGADAVVADFRRLRPFRSAAAAGLSLIERMIAERRFDLAQSMAASAGDLLGFFVLIPLARAGRDIDPDGLARGLVALKLRFALDADTIVHRGREQSLGPCVVDMLLTAVELLVARRKHMALARNVLAPFLGCGVRRIDRLRDYDVPLLDAIIRAYCLRQRLDGENISADEILTCRRDEPDDDSAHRARSPVEDSSERKLKDAVRVMTAIYAERARLIVSALDDDGLPVSLGKLRGVLRGDGWMFYRSRSESAIRARVSERLIDLVMIGADHHAVVQLAFDVRKGVWPGGEGGVRALCMRLCAFPELHEELLRRVMTAASSERGVRRGAEEKSRTLAHFAELLIPISPSDASALFQQAVEVASELDYDVMDQLRVLHRLIEHSHAAVVGDRREYAGALAEIVYDAGIRLSGVDDFPWADAMSAIARVDVAYALACVARWHDEHVAEVEEMLPAVIAIGLQKGFFDSAQAAALLCFLANPSAEMIESIFARAHIDDQSIIPALSEEIAHDCLVHRIPWEEKVVALLSSSNQGHWTQCLRRELEFRSTLKSADGERTGISGESQRQRHAGKRVPVGSRINCLNELADDLGREPNSRAVDRILEAADEWYGQPAVAQWCKSNLPRIIAGHLETLAGNLPWDDSNLETALRLANVSVGSAQDLLLEGIERGIDRLGGPAVIALAGRVGDSLSAADAASVARGYIDRLLSRIVADDRERIDSEHVPADSASAVARFLFAYMSDVDVRLRWRSAHAVRRLGRLEHQSSLSSLISAYQRKSEATFRARGAPFYWIAARLWLLIAIERVSEEVPSSIQAQGKTLLQIALCDEFPHLLVRQYAADACRRLIGNGRLRPNNTQLAQLGQVNRGSVATQKTTLSPVSEENTGGKENSRRFPFDHLDSVRYWYEPWVRVFDGVTLDDFLDCAEEWIVNRWNVHKKSRYRLDEPREQRFPGHLYQLSNNSHGSNPTLEHYQTYLEWHAMWCAAGELLGARSLAVTGADDPEYDSLLEKVAAAKPTGSPQWSSDFVGSVPLQGHRWSPCMDALDVWLESIEDTGFLRELFPEDRSGWVVVNAHMEAGWTEHHERVSIWSGLVSPQTAHALVRALQSARSERSFYICPEGNEHEIETPDFVLEGWVEERMDHLGLDEKDVFRNGRRRVEVGPGSVARDRMGLEYRFQNGATWRRKGACVPSFVYETWGDSEDDGSAYESGDVYAGHRLLMRKHDLAEFLCGMERDLIVEVGITRRERREGYSSYDPENTRESVFDRLLVLQRSGMVEAAECGLGTWR